MFGYGVLAIIGTATGATVMIGGIVFLWINVRTYIDTVQHWERRDD